MRILLVDVNPFMAAQAPISLGVLGAVLRTDGHRVTLLGLGSDSRLSAAGLARRLRELDPELVGFGAYQRNMVHVRGLATLVKQVVPGCRVVLGGPQAMFMPDTALQELSEVDFLSRGEGELAILALVEALVAGTADDEPISGITSRHPDGGAVTGPRPEPATNLDSYPSPWLTGVLDPADWSEAVLLASRGCPHHCLFCLTPAAFGEPRWYSVERVLDEIEVVAARGSGRLWFADPNFCARADRVVAVLEGVLARALDVRLWIELRAEMVTPELIPLLERAGVERVAMGLESARPDVLARLAKGIEPDRVARAARGLLGAGIDVELFSQYALPGESLDDALATLRFVQGCGVAIRGNSNAQQMQLYFGSEINHRHREYGVRPLRSSFPPHLSIGTEFETDAMPAADIARVRAAWRDASADGARRVVS
jgi:radical SAM superfamily enzyme YgiQ (UPF0313 family)